MISEKNGYDYLKKMIKLETKMKNFYASMASKVKDQKLKETFSHISEEEAKHEKIVSEMMAILKKYI